MRNYRNHREVLIERLRNNQEEMDAYLEVALEEFAKDNDLPALLLALRTVAEAQGGIANLAQKTAISRQTLHQALSAEGNPTMATMNSLVNGLGYRLAIKPNGDRYSSPI